MKFSLMLLVNLNYSLYDHKTGFAILYTLIRWTRKATGSSSFLIRMYRALLWQAENVNKICYLLFFFGAELRTCHQASHEQEVCTDFSGYFSCNILILGLFWGWCVFVGFFYF